MRHQAQVRDPVCGMMVEPGCIGTTYLSISFSFCSQQCLERFLAHPQLYVGSPTRRAPRQAGVESIKRRRLRLSAALEPEQVVVVAQALRAMMGVKDVVASGDMLTVGYDLLLATEEQIEAKLVEVGVGLGQGWAERLRRAFVHYEEECEAGNLAAPGETHCHGADAHGAATGEAGQKHHG